MAEAFSYSITHPLLDIHDRREQTICLSPVSGAFLVVQNTIISIATPLCFRILPLRAQRVAPEDEE